MVVSWPSSLSEYTLEYSDTLSSQTWTAVSSGIADNAGTKSYTFATPATPRYFRLTRPAGLKGEYFNNMTLSGSPVLTRSDAAIDFDWGTGSPAAQIPTSEFSVRWTGQIQPRISGAYTFTTTGDDGTRLWVNDALVIDAWMVNGDQSSAPISLNANQKYNLRMEYWENHGDARARLRWSGPLVSQQVISSLYFHPASPATIPNVPANPNVVAVSPNQLDFSWTDSSTDETSFVVERRMSGNPNYAVVGEVAAGSTVFQDSGLLVSTKYYYRVSAKNAAGTSAASNIVATFTLPNAPTGVSATAVSSSQINLAWTDSTTNETAFVIERRVSGNPTYSILAETAADTTSFQDTNLPASTKYYYRISVQNPGGESAYSEIVNATTEAGGGGTPTSQLVVLSPPRRIVYQRTLANQGNIPVAGQAPTSTTRVEARLVPVNGGALVDWTNIPITTGAKSFHGSLTANGGWYQLEIRAWADATLAGQATVSRVGVGEVFVVAGQSNAYGPEPAAVGANDDRVSCLDFKDDSLNEQLMPMVFSKATLGTNVGPSNPLYIWGRLGDRLVSRLGVPVLFLGAATPGTSSDQWRETAAGLSAAPDYFPYRRLSVTLLHYINRTGARAVLWHQGEGDVGRNPQTYFENLQYIINKSRQQTNSSPLAWMVCRATYVQGQTDSNIINAQNRVIAETTNVFAGPNTDVLSGTENRSDNTHFNATGQTRLTDLFYDSMNDNFFNNAQPYSLGAGASPMITTGHVLPYGRNAGDQVWVSYVRNGMMEGGNQFTVQLLNASNNSLVATLGSSTQNPISVTLPGNLPNGSYRMRVVSSAPGYNGNVGENFQTPRGSSPAPSGTPPQQPTVTGGTMDPGITKFGYKYDAISHGFQLLAKTTVSVEVRMERLDGGFGETNWGGMSPASTYTYSHFRYYDPAPVGVGGVVPGRYRMSIRKSGDSGAGWWAELYLLNESFPVYLTE